MMEYFDIMIKVIADSVHSLDKDSFDLLLKDSQEALVKGNKIIVTGLGKNVPICEKFVGTMLSLGLNAYFLHTNSAVHGDMGAIKDGDVVIVLTKSGETTESVYLTSLIKDRPIKLWLLSFCQKSTLALMIENKILLELEHEGDLWNIMPNNSTVMNLIILQALAMELAKSMNLTIDDFRKNHPGGHIGELLKYPEK